MKRRLAAILAADVAGYGAMIQRDEMGTIRTLKGHLSAFDTQLGLHHGRLIKTMGDGFIAEFASVTDAVACAEMLQRVSDERNQMLDGDDQVRFRMGVHAGDVVEDGDDLLGDGINMAARLEAIADPGTVTMSARVHDEVADRLDMAFADLGLRELKPGERPIRVYRVAPRVSARPVLPDLPDKPSIAVLPMLIFSDNREDAYLADGLTEDLTTALAGVPWLFVIARNSSFSYKGLSVDVRRIGRELGVRYVVEGSLRRAGNQVRISAELADTSDGRQIWSHRYDGTLDNVFDLQDRIVAEVTATVAPQIQMAEIRRSVRKRPDDQSAYDLYLSALDCVNAARVTQAEEHLRRAITIFPDYASAKAVLGWCSTLSTAAWQTTDAQEKIQQLGIRMCQAALDSPNRDLETEAYAGYALAFLGQDVARNMDLVAGAVQQSPSFAWALTSQSMLEAFYGDPVKGRIDGETALRINPRDPQIFRTLLALTNCDVALGDYGRALSRVDDGLGYNSGILGMLMWKVVCLVELGRMDEAQEARRRMTARHPLARAAGFEFIGKRFPNQRSVEPALIAAGLPA